MQQRESGRALQCQAIARGTQLERGLDGLAALAVSEDARVFAQHILLDQRERGVPVRGRGSGSLGLRGGGEQHRRQ